MPLPSEILAITERIARAGLPFAIVWHALIAVAVVLAAGGFWRPSRRGAAVLSTLPLLSVSAASFVFGNPFNGAVFAAAFIALVLLGTRLEAVRLARPPAWMTVTGALCLAFGLTYPHFLGDVGWHIYLFAAPVGLVPCPTLAAICGLALLGAGFGSRAWTLLLGALALFYAVFGMFRLGVWLDVGLLFAALNLFAAASSAHPRAGHALERRPRPG